MHPAAVLILLLIVSLILSGGGAIAPALGADCGTGVGPCSCGDRVVTPTRLSAADPILRAPCACDGITVAADVVLDIAGTIQGNGDLSGACTGVLIEIDASNVVVRNGKIQGFGFGVLGQFGVNVRVSGIRAFSNGGGIHVEGTRIVVDGSVVRDNNEGIAVFGWPEGAEVVVRSNRADRNGLGIYVAAESAFRVTGNVATNNNVGFALDGIGASGTFTVEFNRAKGNRWTGFGIGGEDIQVIGNVSTQNGWGTAILPRDGFASLCIGCRFSQNRSSYNGGWGIFDGYGNAYDNVYMNNRCAGNALGPSDPSGLCR